MKNTQNKGLVKYAITDEQLDVINDIIPVLDKAGINLRFGTSIGKHPQTIIFDKSYQDSILCISPDGYDSDYLPRYNGEEFRNADELQELINE
jgi:hypothetical protein